MDRKITFRHFCGFSFFFPWGIEQKRAHEDALEELLDQFNSLWMFPFRFQHKSHTNDKRTIMREGSLIKSEND